MEINDLDGAGQDWRPACGGRRVVDDSLIASSSANPDNENVCKRPACQSRLFIFMMIGDRRAYDRWARLTYFISGHSPKPNSPLVSNPEHGQSVTKISVKCQKVNAFFRRWVSSRSTETVVFLDRWQDIGIAVANSENIA
jgi:hypothetical protein